MLDEYCTIFARQQPMQRRS